MVANGLHFVLRMDERGISDALTNDHHLFLRCELAFGAFVGQGLDADLQLGVRPEAQQGFSAGPIQALARRPQRPVRKQGGARQPASSER
jgi:hypothetical protein